MGNVKIVSSTKSMKMHYNVVTKRSVHHPHFEYRIRLADKVADFIRRNTNICRKYMIDPDEYAYYLDDENIVKYGFLAEPEDCDRINDLFIETVERISNLGNENYFINHLLTNDGDYKFPADIHTQLHEEYGLFDISDDDFEICFDSNLEWNVAHFFIHLKTILFDPGYEGEKRHRDSRIIICGGRHFEDYDRMESVMNEVISKIDPWRDVIEIVSGNCEGADQLGELFAKNHELPCKVFPAQWGKYGKAAGPIRNSEMIKYASEAEMPVVVAFRNPRTRGTNDTVKKATNKGFKVFVYDYDKENSF